MNPSMTIPGRMLLHPWNSHSTSHIPLLKAMITKDSGIPFYVGSGSKVSKLNKKLVKSHP